MSFSRNEAPGPKMPSKAFANSVKFVGMFSFFILKEDSRWKSMACLGESPKEDKLSSTANKRILLKLF